MQLILETENPRKNICEEMSSVDEETLNEKPLPNGDVKDTVKEMNGKQEANGSSDCEKIQNKENILSNGDEVDSHKETSDVLSAVKPLDEPILAEKTGIIISAGKSTDMCSSVEETNEAGDILPAEKLIEECLSVEKTEETENVLSARNPIDECALLEEVKGASDIISANEPVEQSLLVEETKEAEDVISAEKSVDLCTLVEESALPKEKLSKLKFEEKEQIVLGTVKQIELDEQQNPEKEMSQLEERKIIESDEIIKLNDTQNSNSDLNKPVKTSSEAISLKNDLDSNINSINESHINTAQTTNKAGLDNSVKDKFEQMEVDDKVNNTFKKELENISEHDITKSISDMVENIVQNLNDDTADDLMEDMERDNNEKVKTTINVEENSVQNIVEESTSNKLTDKTEIGNKKKIEIDESEPGTSVIPESYKIVEEDQNNMEVDQEPIENEDVVQHNDTTDSENRETVLLENLPISEQATSVVTKDKEAPQKPLETADIISSNNVDRSKDNEVTQNNINCDINLPTSIDKMAEVRSGKVQISTTVDTLKEVEKVKEDETDNSEVSELKSGDSSVNNLDDIDSSIAKMEEDLISLISSNIEKIPDTTIKDDGTEKIDKEIQVTSATVSEAKDDASDIAKVKMIKDTKQISEQKKLNEKTPEKVAEKSHIPLIKLSNTMDILSDDEEEPITEEIKDMAQNKEADGLEKQCINLVDDDDIMLIDEDTKEDKKSKSQAESSIEKFDESQSLHDDEPIVSKDGKNKTSAVSADSKKDSTAVDTEFKEDVTHQPEVEKPLETAAEKSEKPKPLIPPDFFKTYRKNLADMTRDDLEEFCILKIVESIIDRSNLNDIRSKLKSMTLTIEEYKKKAMMLTKQNRDLQVVLKSVQEEQKKSTGNHPITPLKITRSVGMQVLMTDKNRRRVMPGPGNGHNTSNNANQVNSRNVRTPNQSPRNTPQKQINNQAIPVPRLVPAGMNVAKPVQVTQVNNITKATTIQNGVKNTSPAQKPEKRTHSRMQSQSSSVTVDLTDDEPPPKVATKTSPAPPVRLVNPQNLLAPRQQFSQQVNSPRKVYIPISINGPQVQHARPGHTIMLKTVGQGPRPRGATTTVVRAPQNVQVRKVVGSRHPAPLPDAMKQYQPPNWKALPPAPDLKLSKVENGIVISWKIEGYQEDSYEEIASYQLYAYQETSAPASTSLWKKIGDVKALPLPMACTLTQFMAGYKYYFAVRAVDIRSRLGPFSLPGSILLLNKM